MAKINTSRLSLLLELLKFNGNTSNKPDRKQYRELSNQIEKSLNGKESPITAEYLYKLLDKVAYYNAKGEPLIGIRDEYLSAILTFLKYESYHSFEKDLEEALSFFEKCGDQNFTVFHSEKNTIAKQWRRYAQHLKADQLTLQPNNYDKEREKAGKIKAACEENNTVFVLLDDQPSETDKNLIKECEELPVIWVGSAEALSECSTTNKTLSNHEFLFFLLLLMDQTIPSKATSSAPSRNHVNKLNNSGTLLMGDIKEMKGENIALGDFHQTNNITKSDK